MTDKPPLYTKIINETENNQWRITISEFRGIEYLNIRKYFLSFDEEWIPLKEGVNMELTFDNMQSLLISVLEILSLAESKELLETHFKEALDYIYGISRLSEKG